MAKFFMEPKKYLVAAAASMTDAARTSNARHQRSLYLSRFFTRCGAADPRISHSRNPSILRMQR
jgi:hypothetical protein